MLTRNSATIFSGPLFSVDSFEALIGSKGWHNFQVIRHPGGVAVLPIHDDGSVTLISQPRPAVRQPLIELPAGRLDPGEEPLDCGKRELLEETGLVAQHFHPLGILHSSPGVFDEIIHLYAATGLGQQPPSPEADEEIETLRLPYATALAMAKDGRISDGKTIAALFRAADMLS